jgi:hypothetical protein
VIPEIQRSTVYPCFLYYAVAIPHSVTRPREGLERDWLAGRGGAVDAASSSLQSETGRLTRTPGKQLSELLPELESARSAQSCQCRAQSNLSFKQLSDRDILTLGNWLDRLGLVGLKTIL